MEIVRFDDAADFAARATPWLLRSEAEYNLLLGLTGQLQDPGHPFDPPLYLATVEDGGEVVGCAFRTPPYKMGLTRIPSAAIAALVEDVAAVYDSLPAILGPEGTCRQFAAAWAARQSVSFADGLQMGIFSLDRLRDPQLPARGCFAMAAEPDIPLVAEWLVGFHLDARLPDVDAERLARSLVMDRKLGLWLDPEPRSMAGATGPTPHGIRIAYVYTPSEFRGRGYASHCVAELTRRQLDSGREFCFLFTDLANPTANAIYRRLGYSQVAEVMDINFGY